MRVFVIGDYRTGTGPANVTKEYLLRLPENTGRLIFRSKILRAIEITVKMPFYDVILFSGYSGQNILGLKWAKMLKKSTAYLMHGCVEHENAINECVDEEMNRIERKTMELSDAILAVSEHFALWLKTYYPEYTDKIGILVAQYMLLSEDEAQAICYAADPAAIDGKLSPYALVLSTAVNMQKNIYEISDVVDSYSFTTIK